MQWYDIDNDKTFAFLHSKPITYGMALNELGNEKVHKYVGTEPSGRMFNAIVLDYNGRIFCVCMWMGSFSSVN